NFARELFVAFSLQRCAIVRSVARERIVQTEPTANEESESQSILLEALEVERNARQKQQLAEAEREAQRLIAEAERRDQMRALLGQNEPVVPVRHIVIPRFVVYGTAAALAAML